MKKNSMYQGDRPFTKQQLVFFAEAIMASAMDMISGGLDAGTTRSKEQKLQSYERGALETAGMSLAVLYAQLTGLPGMPPDDGLGVYDALTSGKIEELTFDNMIEKWVSTSVEAGKNTAEGGYHPDPHPWAVVWVETLFPDLSFLPKGGYRGFDQWGNILLSNNGVITFPDDNGGTIRRCDVYGNCEEVREIGDDNYSDWLKMFLSSKDRSFRCPNCGSFEITYCVSTTKVGIPHCADCGIDKAEV